MYYSIDNKRYDYKSPYYFYICILWAFANIIRAEPNNKTLANIHGEAFVLLLVSWGLGLGGRKLAYVGCVELCIIQIRLCANLDCNNNFVHCSHAVVNCPM